MMLWNGRAVKYDRIVCDVIINPFVNIIYHMFLIAAFDINKTVFLSPVVTKLMLIHDVCKYKAQDL